MPPPTPESLPRFAPLSRIDYSRKGKGRHQEELPDSPGREGLKGEVIKPKEIALRLDNAEADGGDDQNQEWLVRVRVQGDGWRTPSLILACTNRHPRLHCFAPGQRLHSCFLGDFSYSLGSKLPTSTLTSDCRLFST